MEEKPEKKENRLVKIIKWVSYGIIGLSTLAEVGFYSWKKLYQQPNFGTVVKPTYPITQGSSGNKDLQTLEVMLESSWKDNDVELEYQEYNKFVPSFNPRDKAKQLFKQLTGKKLEKIDFVVEREINKNLQYGYHSCVLGRISVRSNTTIRDFIAHMHELGHAITQHQEENITGPILSLVSSKKHRKDVKALEEACGHANAAAGIDELYKTNPNEALMAKLVFEVEMQSLLREHQTKRWDPHAEGAAIYLATRHVLKDPKSTFNYISTLKDSDLSNLNTHIKQALVDQREVLGSNNYKE